MLRSPPSSSPPPLATTHSQPGQIQTGWAVEQPPSDLAHGSLPSTLVTMGLLVTQCRDRCTDKVGWGSNISITRLFAFRYSSIRVSTRNISFTGIQGAVSQWGYLTIFICCLFADKFVYVRQLCLCRQYKENKTDLLVFFLCRQAVWNSVLTLLVTESSWTLQAMTNRVRRLTYIYAGLSADLCYICVWQEELKQVQNFPSGKPGN